MSILTCILACGVLLAAWSSSASAQGDSAKPRKFKTTYKIQMFAEPDFHSKKLTDIPDGVILEALEETERYGGYVRVNYKNKTGWVLKADMQRYMDVPAPELACFSNGYKVIGSTYRYFFVIRNDGVAPYAGKVTLRLFDQAGKVVYERTADFSDEPIQPDRAGNFPVDTSVEAPQFELEHKDGKITGSTGKFIERM